MGQPRRGRNNISFSVMETLPLFESDFWESLTAMEMLSSILLMVTVSSAFIEQLGNMLAFASPRMLTILYWPPMSPRTDCFWHPSVEHTVISRRRRNMIRLTNAITGLYTADERHGRTKPLCWYANSQLYRGPVHRLVSALMSGFQKCSQLAFIFFYF